MTGLHLPAPAAPVVLLIMLATGAALAALIAASGRSEAGLIDASGRSETGLIDASGRSRVEPVPANRRVAVWLARERRRAEAAGWRAGWLLVARGAAALSSLPLGWLAGSVWLGGVWLLGVQAAIPWLLGEAASRRRGRLERELMAGLSELAARMERAGQPLDLALRDIARAARGELGVVLAPLGDPAVSVKDGLCLVAERADSPIFDMLAADLLIARERDPMVFRAQLVGRVLPMLERSIQIQDQAAATRGMARMVVYTMLGVLVAVFLATNQLDEVRALYGEWQGGLLLATCAALFIAAAALMDRMVPSVSWTRWRVERLREELDAIGR